MVVLIGLVAVAFAMLLGAGLLSGSTALAGIEGRSFGKALGATVAAALAGFVVSVVLSLVGFEDGFIGWSIGLATYLAVIRGIYATSWGKAFLAWILQIVVVLILLVPLMAFGGIAAILR